MDVNLEPDFLPVTERAAVESAQATGCGTRKLSDRIAVEAMRRELDSPAIRGTGIRALKGIGGAPEGVITAAALRCLDGEVQGSLAVPEDRHRRRLEVMR
jgi:fructose-1,6-bisphosphatase II